MNRNLVGKVRLAIIKCPRLTYRVKTFVRLSLIGKHCRTYYYEYRNGTRLISPDVQEEVRGLFREAGWNEEVHFDSYIEDYEW